MSFIPQLESIQAQAMQFSDLSDDGLNWKPAADRWSVSQCLDHLITSNETYFQTFDQIIAGAYRPSFWCRVSPLTGFFGNLMKKTLSPDSAKKYPAPKIFAPSRSDFGRDILNRFYTHQEKLKEYFVILEANDPVVIPSPVTGFVTYKLPDALAILVNHEQRHINQAKRVLQHPDFPKQPV